ncbi:esterase/lipase family protein [Nakamurella antarctica]|nr:alpha/beta fold hydrolase [Nakamurella antarctica]
MNDASCRSQHLPVLLLHGTFSKISADYSLLVPQLQKQGWCIFGRDYGLMGTGPVADSAASFASFVSAVRQATGTSQVDVVAYSQGGLVLRTALRNYQIADFVDTAVLIAPSFHGTTSPLIDALPDGLCPACADQKADSALIDSLNAGGDLDGTVRYAVASLTTDQVVIPWQSQVPQGPSDRVTSVVVDQVCPLSTARHENLTRSAAVISWTVAALATQGRPHAADMVC